MLVGQSLRGLTRSTRRRDTTEGPAIAEVMVTTDAGLRDDAFGVRVDLPVAADRAFCCDHLLVVRPPGDGAELFAVHDAQPIDGRPGWSCVGAVLLGRVRIDTDRFDALQAGTGAQAGDGTHDAAAPVVGIVRSPAGRGVADWLAAAGARRLMWLPGERLAGVSAVAGCPARDPSRLLELRAHWDQRYALPGREPLTTPVTGLVAWLADRADRPLLLLGDGEGRNAIPAAVDGRPVRMLELSAVAVQTCRRLNRSPSLQVATGDFVRWARVGLVQPRTLVAATYVGPFGSHEWQGITAFLARTLERGGGFYWEAARAGLSRVQQDELCRLGATTCTEYRRGDVERIICSVR